MDDQQTASADDGVSAEIRELLKRAEAGDETVLPALRGLFDSRPDLWRMLSDMSSHAEQTLLKASAGDNMLVREALSRRLAVIKNELTTATSSPQERLLVDGVALCWLHMHLAELEVAAYIPGGQSDGPRAREAQRRLDRAHWRYLTAHKQLALMSETPRSIPAAYDPALWSVD